MLKIKFSQQVLKDFTQVPNNLFYLHSLSTTERLLLAFLMSHQANWIMYYENTANQLGINRKTLGTSMKNLQDKGFIKIQTGFIIVQMDVIDKVAAQYRDKDIREANDIPEEKVNISERLIIDDYISSTIFNHTQHFNQFDTTTIDKVKSMKIQDVLNYTYSNNKTDVERCMWYVGYFFKQSPEYIKINNLI